MTIFRYRSLLRRPDGASLPSYFVFVTLHTASKIGFKRSVSNVLDLFCKIIAIADFEKCGYDYLLPIGIRVQGDKLEEVAEILSQQKEVFSVNVVSGIQDIEILCATQSLKETKIFLDENNNLEAYFVFTKDNGELGKFVSESFNRRILN